MGTGPQPGESGCFCRDHSLAQAVPHKIPHIYDCWHANRATRQLFFFPQETEQLANRWTQTQLWVETMGDLLLHVFAPRSGGFV